MKNFIFGKSCVTKKDTIMANCLIRQAKALENAAYEERANNDGDATIHACWLLFRALRLHNKAARKLGFRNIDDLSKYLEKHGKL